MSVGSATCPPHVRSGHRVVHVGPLPAWTSNRIAAARPKKRTTTLPEPTLAQSVAFPSPQETADKKASQRTSSRNPYTCYGRADVPGVYLSWSSRIPAIYLGPHFRRSRPSHGGGPLTVAYHARHGPGRAGDALVLPADGVPALAGRPWPPTGRARNGQVCGPEGRPRGGVPPAGRPWSGTMSRPGPGRPPRARTGTGRVFRGALKDSCGHGAVS
jgi:hypothetical protein